MNEPASPARGLGQTAQNAAAAAGQVIVSGILFLILYRYLLGTIGASSLGIWSLVLASTNVSRLSGLGLQGTAVRFVARYLARGERYAAAHVVETALIATGAVIGAAAIAAYPLVQLVLTRLVDAPSLVQASAILPYALASLWMNVLSGVTQSGLDGCQRADLRSGTTVLANAVYVGGAVVAVPFLGLSGLAMAQVTQSVLLLVWSWTRLRSVLPELGAVPRYWDKTLFREMVRYGANFQAESILAMLHDPIVKLLLSHFGGLASVGYFEMASRLVLQVKALVTAGFQVLVPVIADYQESDPGRVRQIYAAAAELLVYVTVPTFGALAVAAALVGRLWIGHDVPDFVVYLDILCAAWLVNALSVPAMNANFGTGYIGWHTIGAAVISVVNIALGIPAGWIWGGHGVVASWAVALTTGSVLVGLSYHRRTQTPPHALFSPASVHIIVATAVSVTLAALLAITPLFSSAMVGIGKLCVAPVAYAILMAVPLWRHISRQRLISVVVERLPPRRTRNL